MNIVEIKTSFNGICISADIWHPDDMALVNELIYKLEQAEEVLKIVKQYGNKTWTSGINGSTLSQLSERALQAIRK